MSTWLILRAFKKKLAQLYFFLLWELIQTNWHKLNCRWSIIAAQLPGRTDNDIKNYWNTKLKKKLFGLFPPSSQRKPHQAATLSSLLQASSSTSTSSYKGSNNNNTNYYNSASASPSFTDLEFAAAPILQAQDSFVSPLQNYHVKDNLLMFGSEATSCSSSDGSSNNLISHSSGETYGEVQMGLQNYFNYNGNIDGNQRFMISNGVNGNGLWASDSISTPIDYGLEEIKQLISTSSCNNFLFDEHKTEEKPMYYWCWLWVKSKRFEGKGRDGLKISDLDSKKFVWEWVKCCWWKHFFDSTW